MRSAWKFLTSAFAALAALAAVCGAARLGAPEEARRVLILTSFGSRFAPFDTFGSELRSEIARGWPGPVEFLDTPFEIARFESQTEEQPFAQYLGSLVANRHLDLVVTLGGPAADFVTRQRPFPTVPTLIAGLERRQAAGLELEPNELVAAVLLDPPGVVANMLRLLPDTRQIAVVLGASPVERYWHGQLEEEFASFAGRVSFFWLDAMPLDEIRRKAAALGPGAALLYGTLRVDATGVAYEEEEGLAALRSVAKVPIFGAFEHELGRGIVGGPLISIAHEAHRAGGVALRILRGDPLSNIAIPPPLPLIVAYDWRELSRFGISTTRLPSGSVVRYSPPPLWAAYRRGVLIALGVVALQAILIAGLLAQRAERRRAEEQVRALNRRLMTAQEDERKLIARELHDDLSQRLARLSMDAARIEYSAALPVDGRPQAPMREELAQLSEDVHALAYQLHPSTLDELGLVEALKVECERFSRLESTPVALDTGDALPEPSRETALCFFRIAQEGLRNVARHARAKSVTLSCRPADGGLRMVLADDGVGFALAPRRGRPSLGLASMRERVELIGGRLEVYSAPGRGTSITAWAPLAPGAA